MLLFKWVIDEIALYLFMLISKMRGFCLMSTSKNRGTCLVCQENIEHRSITKHIEHCLEKYERNKRSNNYDGKEKIFRMKMVSEKYFWLYVEVNGSALLEDLDFFLREIWLECCDHLSQFKIDGERYLSNGGMNKVIHRLFKVGTKFHYEYAFGSTTELEGQVISIRFGELENTIRLLARNCFPEIFACVNCQKKSAVICSVCFDLFCAECQGNHDDCEGEEFMLPAVNSPRLVFFSYTLLFD